MACLCSHFAVFTHRFGQFTCTCCHSSKKNVFIKAARCIYHLLRYFCVVFCKILFWEDVEIGSGVRFAGKGNIIVGAERIGDNCLVHHNVTFGMHLAGSQELTGKPKIGVGVWIGPNSIIYGNITIGNGTTILGGTVLTKSVPANCVVQGNPAKILQRGFNNERLLGSTSCEVITRELEKLLKEDVC